ncbi:MAG: hypothetical protein LBH62_00950 [Nitrososphaerota archaeon]|jgi:TPR repeat protein|nr:hypothetical protein [Nitrososphaerota archaeon]
MVELNELKIAAAQGYAPALFNLGLCYDKGDGVPQSDKKAAELWEKAADQGYAPAQHNLGVYYDEGRGGVGRSSTEAAKLWEKAAQQDFDDAQFNLGICYLNGDGVKRDPENAVYWFTKAADQHHVPAQFNLGLCYGKGDGVRGGRNPDKAIELVAKAAAANWFEPAITTLKKFRESGMEIPEITQKMIDDDHLARYKRVCTESSVPSLTWKEYGKVANRFRASFLRGYKNAAELAEELDNLAEKAKAVAYQQLFLAKEQVDNKPDVDVAEYRRFVGCFQEFGFGYEDVAKLVKECNDKVRVAELKNQYDDLIASMAKAITENDFKYLADEFRNMGNYLDAITKAEECEKRYQELKNVRLQPIYVGLLAKKQQLENQNSSNPIELREIAKDWESLANEFLVIKEHLDASDLVQKCKQNSTEADSKAQQIEENIRERKERMRKAIHKTAWLIQIGAIISLFIFWALNPNFSLFGTIVLTVVSFISFILLSYLGANAIHERVVIVVRSSICIVTVLLSLALSVSIAIDTINAAGILGVVSAFFMAVCGFGIIIAAILAFFFPESS